MSTHQGPLPIITTDEAEFLVRDVLPHHRDEPRAAELLRRLGLSVHAHPSWRKPLGEK